MKIHICRKNLVVGTIPPQKKNVRLAMSFSVTIFEQMGKIRITKLFAKQLPITECRLPITNHSNLLLKPLFY